MENRKNKANNVYDDHPAYMFLGPYLLYELCQLWQSEVYVGSHFDGCTTGWSSVYNQGGAFAETLHAKSDKCQH